MWSKSVWVSQIQRSSPGSITDVSADMNSAPPATVPVSTRTGSLPCSTNALMASEPRAAMSAALVGDEGELAPRIGDQHSAVARVADAPPRSHGVVPHEGGALHGDGDVALPVDALALWAPRPDAGQVGDHRVQRVGAGFDVELDVVFGQPPTLVLRCHRSFLLSW